MDNLWIWLVAAVVVVALVVGYVVLIRVRNSLAERASHPRPASVEEAEPSTEAAPSPQETPEVEVPAPTAGRLVRLRSRLSRSNSALGKGLLALLASDKLDDDVWEEVEDTLLAADVGIADTTEIVESLRERVKVLGTRTPPICGAC
ncbi:hypothetical protein GCM10029992_30180 [Glycomyces albus]